MSDLAGSAVLSLLASLEAAGAKSTFSSAVLSETVTFKSFGHTNALRFMVDTPGTLGMNVDTPQSFSGFVVDVPGSLGPPVVTGKVMLVDASAGEAYVEKDLGTTYPELWITWLLRLDPATVARWEDGAENPQIITVDIASGGGGNVDAAIIAAGLPGWETVWSGPSGTLGSPGLHTLELHYVNVGPSDIYLDHLLIVNGTNGSGLDGQFLQVGIRFASAASPNLCYFDNVKAGTTRGDANVFSDNFDDGTLDAWTNDVGDVSVVEDPF